ncbi:mechanosensitive ion channel family protein [Planktothrix sp. FACHB-1365]|uniref:mechanosensitive ion channel family protein n=1 Tax=Planktothrix sp. FACHB-1365 TaxID=2692855 RepID=UPI001687F571|nr:mechanosensitive ion channel domain-containing protein [Planktothrix sp. FACHB-1365]MBD2484922.1 mechanosensitive ion channel [Planktothrix sp. FACHB-1365]
MSNQPDLTFLVDQITKLLIFLARSPVQIQLVVILISIVLSHGLSYGVSKKILQQFKQFKISLDKALKEGTTLAPYWCGLGLIPDLVGRGFNLIVLTLVQNLFTTQGWITGLLSTAIQLLWVYLFYRVFSIGLCLFVPIHRVKEYKFYFFRPIFILYVLREILSLFLDINQLMQVEVINLFNSPITLEAIFISTVGLYLWIVAVSILQYVILQIIVDKTELDSGAFQASLILIRYFLIGLGIVIVIGYIGFNPTAFAAITGGLSVGIGFGLKEIFSDLISGILLLFEGSLRPGDIIEIGGESSEVKKVSIRATTVQVIRDNSEKIIPNQLLFTQELKTMTGSDRRVRKSLIVGVSYDCNPQDVIEILLEIVYQHREVLNDPAPLVYLINFGESSLDFEIAVWLETPIGGKRIMSEISCEIWKTFADKNIEIPYPQRDLHIRSDIRHN